MTLLLIGYPVLRYARLMVRVGVEIVERFLFDEVAVRHEVVNVRVRKRRPRLHVRLVRLLLHLSSVYLLHGCLVLRNKRSALIGRHHRLILPRARVLLTRHRIRRLSLVRHAHL